MCFSWRLCERPAGIAAFGLLGSHLWSLSQSEHFPAMKMRQTISAFEVAFEQESALERRRREQLRRRAANRSRARRITRTEQKGKVRFSVLVGALTITVIIVVFAMFETLAWLMA